MQQYQQPIPPLDLPQTGSLDDHLSQRWRQLVPISLTFVVLTLNWFVIAAAFPQLGQQFHLGVSQLSDLVGMFILGFALAHIPAGVAAYSIGVKRTLLLGLFVESLVGGLCAIAPNYQVLLLLRLVAGLGGGAFVNMSLALVSSWFRGKELALALALSAAASFALGQVLALLGWIPLIDLMGWRGAILLAGGIGLGVWLVGLLFLRVPGNEAQHLSGGSIEWREVRHRVFFNRDLWFVGLSFFGVYGAGMLVAQLLPIYLGQMYHLSADLGGRYAAAFVLMAIPGGLLGGYVAHRFHLLRAAFVWPWVLLGVSVCLLPFFGMVGVALMILFAGAGPQFGFSAWSAMPGRYTDRIRPVDVATAEGLILTAGGLGGFILPVIFGILETRFGFSVAFVFVGITSIVFALIGLAARQPLHFEQKD